MKFLSFLIAVMVLLTSCSESKKEETKDKKSNNEPDLIFQYDKLEGVYEGDFGGKGDIRIVLRHVTGTHAVGYDLHKGLRRNISGKMNPDGSSFTFRLMEPGDNPYDGEFNFKIDTTTFKLTGNWKPGNNAQLKAKNFTLTRIAGGLDTTHSYSEGMMDIMFDTLGAEYHFEENGLLIYRYYPRDEDEAATQQYEEIKGNWKKTDKEYIIDWQKNTIFPAQRSIFKIVPYPESEGNYYYLEGEGRKIEPHLAG